MTRRLRFWAAVALGYTALALAYTWPLPRRLGTGVAHDPWDPLLNTWILEWTADRAPWKTGWWDAPAFAPMAGTLGLSEHLLGFWPFSAPLQALGVPPLIVYNVLVIASFALCALTTAWLVTSLTHSRLAGVVAGCLWGFAPYRLAQLAHVQILAAWWAPLALLALHRQAEVGGWRWATVFAVCWLWLSLTSGYHLAFFSVVAGIVGLWLFARRDRLAHARPVVVTTAVATLVLLPLLLGYTAIHERQGLTRQPKEVDEYAADAAHLLQAPALSRLWGGHSAEYEEVALFPGVGLIGGVLLALVLALRPTGGEVRRGHDAELSRDAVDTSGPARAVSWRLARTLALLALVPLTLALVAGLNPGQYVVAGLRISLTRPSKPATVACVLVTLAALASPPGRRMLRARSLAGLYAIVALVTWVLTLGPRARVGGVLVFDYAPYAWLMALPGGLAMRVAPRFWFWSVLALSIVAATGITALQRRSPRVALAAGVLIAGLGLADGWPREMPVATLPRDAASALPSVAPGAPVLELPIGRWGDDVAAMWRGMRLGRRVVNGYSGYDPAHYRVLTTALDEDDPDVLRVLAESSGLVVAVDRTRPGADAAADLARRAGARPVSDAAAWALVELPSSQASPAPDGRHLTPTRVVASDGEDVTAVVTDDDRYTAWHSDVPAAEETALVVELPAVRDVAGIEIGQGVFPAEYPKRLRVEARTPAGWVRVFEGGTAGLALRAVLAAPTSPRLRVSLSGVTTQTLRLVLAEPQAKRYWSVASLAVLVR